ncbi:MAG: efflux transporter outer membrane subunit [Aquabacterium sp.]|nr:MAG: efflux transporter outer membrane subunit [Aquabacterium sp.]
MKSPQSFKRAALAPLLAALVLAGCASVPPIDTSAVPAAPAAFKEGDGRWTTAAPAEAQARGEWWKAFADPQLDALVQRAGERNTDVQVAASRLAQARALLQSADADRTPQLGLAAGASRGTDANATTLPRPIGSQFNLGATLSYELDLFGRLSGTSRAAALDARQREALLQSTRLLVQANTAQTYLALRAADEELALMRDTVASYRNTERLVERRLEAGDVAELDLMRIRTQVASTESDALALERRRAELEHALAVLVGDAASAFSVAPQPVWSTALPVIPAGVPSTVLARRPDVSAAQAGMLAAQARVGVAKAAWFPAISLTANGGQASPELDDLFKWSARSWGVGALLSLPIFDGGRREAGERVAAAQLDAALAGYREQVLVAFRDVEDQLSALRLLSNQADAQGRAVAAAGRASKLSESRYRNGLISQIDLLDAQRSELANKRQALQVRSAQYQATVGLVRALGGSWDGVERVGSAEEPTDRVAAAR